MMEATSSYESFQLPLEVVKNELVNALLSYCEHSKTASLQDIVQSALAFDEGGQPVNSKLTKDDGGEYLKKFADQVEYIRCATPLVNLFPTRIAGEFGWKLLRDCEKLLKVVYGEVQRGCLSGDGSDDKRLRTNLVQSLISPVIQLTHDSLDVNCTAIIKKKLLTTEVIEGDGVNRAHQIGEEAIKYGQLIFEDSIKFLVSSCRWLEKSDFLRILALCQKVWRFLRSVRNTFNAIADQGEISVIEDSLVDDLPTLLSSENGRSFLKFWFENVCASSEESKFLQKLHDDLPLEHIPEPYMIFTVYLDDPSFWRTDVGKAVTPIVIQGIRRDLSSDKPETRKRAAFVLQIITTFYSQSKPLFHPDLPEVSTVSPNELSVNLYKKFWTNFFELYNILDESQSHIIQPVLHKLNVFHECSAHEHIFVWLPTLLKKMVIHDNRAVVKEGLERFLETGQYFQTHASSAYRNIAKGFLEDRIMPLLKDLVGWVLNEAEDFFRITVTFARFLLQLYSDSEYPHLCIAEMLLMFLMSSGKCMSPQCIFFYVTTLDEVLKAGPYFLPQENDDGYLKEKVESCFNLLAVLVSNSLTTISKYFRDLLEITCVKIFHRISATFLHFPTGGIKSVIVQKLLIFLGSVSEKFFNGPESQEKLPLILLAISGHDQNIFESVTTKGHLYDFCKSNLGPGSVLGMFRFLIVHYRQIGLEAAEEERKILHETLENFVKHAGNDDLAHGVFLQGLKEFHQAFPEIGIPAVYANMVKEVYDTLQKSEATISVLDFERTIRLIRLISAVPAAVNEGPVPDFRCPSDSTRLFILRKLYSLNNSQLASSIEKVHDLKRLGEEGFGGSMENVEGVCKKYFENTGRHMSAEFYGLTFDIYTKVADKKKDIDVSLKEKILELVLESLEKCDPKGVASGLGLAASVIRGDVFDDHSEVKNVLSKLVTLGWSLIFELRKNERFWHVAGAFFKLLVCPHFLQTGDLSKYADLVFEHGENILGLQYLLVQHLVKVEFPDDVLEDANTVLMNAALAGAPLSKNNRFTFGIWDYVCTKNNEYNHDPENFSYNSKARLLACERLRLNIQRLTSTSETQEKGKFLLYRIVTRLLQRNDDESRTRKRYFGGSQTHRIKQRIFQLLLVLQPLYNYEISKIALRKVVCSLSMDSPQPSVRYLGEWLTTRILGEHAPLYPIFFSSCLEDGMESRVGFGAFFATICLQVSKQLECPDFYDKALQALTALILNQHVMVRIYAQVVFTKIYQRAKDCNYTKIVDKYFTVLTALQSALVNASGNCSKLLENISQDFYVNAFHYKTHFCHEVIFTLLPRIAGMPKDECILHPRSIQNVIGSGLVLPHENVDELQTVYESFEKSVWHLKTVVADGRELGDENPNQLSRTTTKHSSEGQQGMNYQKKINPWKLLSISEEINNFVNIDLKKRNTDEDGLVVVASLLDHLPNLGGLCRTCEIFGVHKYVVNNLKVINDVQFQSLSVSAQNWVNILEVPVRDIEAFLLTYSAKGYSILGVEQANESSSLTNFSFPKKSVLLLGNEKLGIPSELLHLVDKCVEIPQAGIIRSLNVHVTGALCIYQYFTQHRL